MYMHTYYSLIFRQILSICLFGSGNKVKLFIFIIHSKWGWYFHNQSSAPVRRPNNLIVPKKSLFLTSGINNVAFSNNLLQNQWHLKARLPMQTDRIRQVTIMSLYRYTTSCIQRIIHKMASSWIRWNIYYSDLYHCLSVSGCVVMFVIVYLSLQWQWRVPVLSPSPWIHRAIHL